MAVTLTMGESVFGTLINIVGWFHFRWLINFRVMMRILAAILFLGLSLGCVKRGQPIRVHEETPATTKVLEQQSTGLIQNPSSDPLTTNTNSVVDTVVLEQLARELLNREVIDSADTRGNALTARKLWRLNEEFILLLKSKSITKAQQQWLRRYEYFLTEGCSAKGDRCLHFEFFNLSKNSSVVITRLAAGETVDLKRRYNLLKMAYTLKNKRYDSYLAEQMLLMAAAYLEQLASEDRLAANNFAHVLTTVTQQVAERGDVSEMKLLVEKLDLLNLSSRQRLAGLGYNPDVLTQILAKAGGLSLGGGTSEIGQQKVAEYFSKAQSLQKTQEKLLIENASMFRQLNVEPIKDWDETLLVLDQAYMGELSLAQGEVLLRASQATRRDIARKTREIYLIRFLQALADSTSLAQKFFFEQKVASGEFLMHAIRSGSQVQPVWGTFNSRIKTLQTMSIGMLRLMGPDDEIYQQTRRLFDGTQQSIKLMSVYPQMMALTYHMAKRDSKHSVDLGMGRKFDLDSSFIIEKLFLGEFQAWFDYSTDMRRLTFVEMLYAFDFALRTGVFERFKVDPDQFVTEISGRLIRRSTSHIREYKRLLETRTQNLNFKQFERMCDQMELDKIRLVVNLKTISKYPLLGELGASIFTDVSLNGSAQSRSSGTHDKVQQGLMMFDREFVAVAEEARLDLATMQSWLEGLLASYRGYLVRQGSQDVDAKLQTSLQQLNQLKEFRSDFFKLALSMYRKINHCYTKAFRAEETVKLEIMRREEAYLRQVHQDLTRVKNGEVTPESLNAKYIFKNLPSNYLGKNHFTNDSYVYTNLDFWIRSIFFMTKDQILDGKNWPAIAPQMLADFGKTLDADNEVIRNSVSATLIYTEKVDDFVSQAMNKLFNRVSRNDLMSSFTSWYTFVSSRLLMWHDLLHSAAILYRLNDPDLINEICMAPLKCANSQDLISAEEVISQHEEMLDLVKLDPDEKRYIQMAGFYFKFQTQNFNRSLIDYSVMKAYSIQQVWGLYDLPAFLVTRSVLGATHIAQESSRQADGSDVETARAASKEVERHYGFNLLGRSYWNVRRNDARKTFLIPVSTEVDQTLDLSFGNFIRGEIDKVNRFSSVLKGRVKQMAALPTDFRPRADINIIESIREPLLRPNILNNFVRDVEKFQQSTDGCYLSASCESFKTQP